MSTLLDDELEKLKQQTTPLQDQMIIKWLKVIAMSDSLRYMNNGHVEAFHWQ